MIDNFGRKIEYLRLSVTDLCNYRCIYCMGSGGVVKRAHSDILSIEELAGIAEAACALGIKKIRLTGGEPLVRKGIVRLCEMLRAISPELELSMTTNGSLLTRYAHELRSAGLDRLNISLDTLDPYTFRKITRTGELSDVLRGIDSAFEAGFESVKINAVLIGGLNEDGAHELISLTRDRNITVRFIELMPIGIAAGWDSGCFVGCSVLEPLLGNAELEARDGVSLLYRLPGHKGRVGLITPLSCSFCDRCNKIRVTADGKLKPCLYSDSEVDLRGLRGEALRAAITAGILSKPERHNMQDLKSPTGRFMNEIGG